MLSQEEDWNTYTLEQAKTVTKRSPTDAEWRDMHFGTIFAKHTKSNAVIICKNEQIVGTGAGQMSRIDSCKIAISKAKENKFELKGCVSASDAFMPFPDTAEELGKVGVTAIVQPGGSVNDKMSIDMADKFGMAMAFTGIRHFKH